MNELKDVFDRRHRRLVGRDVSISDGGNPFSHHFYENFTTNSLEANKKFAQTE
ncbi:uncharacterized protein METZ01_LOCUS384123 [marine metagenome]|uniref:Uncharacterized protein n=1 Tax=marine metagenome TaxID=408172 RepID=A0A382UAJ3_9ZZZZ